MKKTSLIVVLFMSLFGSFIGFDSSSTSGNVAASAPVVFPEIPAMVSPGPLYLRVDLETGQLDVENARNGEVNVEINHKSAEMQAEYKNPIVKIIEKEVYVENIARSTRLLDRAAPLKMAPLIP